LDFHIQWLAKFRFIRKGKEFGNNYVLRVRTVGHSVYHRIIIFNDTVKAIISENTTINKNKKINENGNHHKGSHCIQNEMNNNEHQQEYKNSV